MVNSQEWLDKNYPKEGVCLLEEDTENFGKERIKIKELDISYKDLKGEIKLENFTNLERLDCYNNKLTILDVGGCLKLKAIYCYRNQLNSLLLANSVPLEEIWCHNNRLTNISWPNLNPKKLSILVISNNNFVTQNLKVFSNFTNLEYLYIGTDDKERIIKGDYNRFVGNLESLKNLTKLRNLSINNTDVDEGLECLPESVKRFNCDTFLLNPKLTKIREQLAPFKYEIKTWRENRKKWEEEGFDNEEIEQLRKAGLKEDEWGFANYLKQNNCNYLSINISELRREYYKSVSAKDIYHSVKEGLKEKLNKKGSDKIRLFNGKEWLEKWYPQEGTCIRENEGYELNNLGKKREEIRKLNISFQKLEDHLDFSDFMNLEELICKNNKLTSLKLNGCPKLKKLNCANNLLTNLDLTENLQLENIDISASNLKGKINELDVTGNQKLKYLNCEGNQLNFLDLSKNSSLVNLNCSSNKLRELILSENNAELTEINCSSNQLTNLAINSIISLNKLECSKNELIALDLSKSTELKEVNCSSNKLRDIDLRNNQDLVNFVCENNFLTNLDLSKNENLTEINCFNNQLKDIKFSPKVEEEPFKLEKVNLGGNKELKYTEIDKKFLKHLPDKLDREVPHIDTKELEKIIKEGLKIPRIEKIDAFSTWFNPNCMLITNKEKEKFYKIRLIICETDSNQDNKMKSTWENIKKECYEEIRKIQNEADGKIREGKEKDYLTERVLERTMLNKKEAKEEVKSKKKPKKIYLLKKICL